MPFLIGAGNLSDEEMSPGSMILSELWAEPLVKFSCEQSPVSVFNSLKETSGLFQLNGDPASSNRETGSWLEALGSWRKPTILFVSPRLSGEIPGAAAAYVALAKSFSVPLIGIVQLEGVWDSEERILDGLPWCGRLSRENDLTWINGNNSKPRINMDNFYVSENLKTRMRHIDI